jgi:hypothetical protein
MESRSPTTSRSSMRKGMTRPNKRDAANPAMAFLFHTGRHWRGVTDPGC